MEDHSAFWSVVATVAPVLALATTLEIREIERRGLMSKSWWYFMSGVSGAQILLFAFALLALGFGADYAWGRALALSTLFLCGFILFIIPLDFSFPRPPGGGSRTLSLLPRRRNRS